MTHRRSSSIVSLLLASGLVALAPTPAPAAATTVLAQRYLNWCVNNLRDGEDAKAAKHCGWYGREAKAAGLTVHTDARLRAAAAAGARLDAKGAVDPVLAARADQYLSWCQNNLRRGQGAKADKHCALYRAEAEAAGLEAFERAAVEAAVARGERLSADAPPAASPDSSPSLPKSAGGEGETPTSTAKLASGRSGLPWASGFACFNHPWSKQNQLEGWRGRELDAVSGWAPRTDWASALKWLKGGGFKALAGSGATPVVSLPLVTDDAAGRFGDCAKGAFDRHHRAAARAVAERGEPKTVFRLGWEANGSWFPWSAGEDPSGYKACFRRAAKVIKDANPQALIEWPMAKKGHLPFNVEKIYPGDDVVDIVGVVLYDRYPTSTTKLAWRELFAKEHQGGPYGPGAWLEWAKARGKPLGIGEWGVSDDYRPGVGEDNALYVERMHAFFANNAEHIAYETYYNCQDNGVYRVFPKSANPQASDEYRRLWKAGASAAGEPTVPWTPSAAAQGAERQLDYFQTAVRKGERAKADRFWAAYAQKAKKAGLPLWTRSEVERLTKVGPKVTAVTAP